MFNGMGIATKKPATLAIEHYSMSKRKASHVFVYFTKIK
jgi:hypothetical protein